MNRVIALHRNILLYRLLLVLGPNGLMTSVIYFFLTSSKGLTPAQALFIVGFAALAKASSEVPTGVVADKFSRKYSIFTGYIILLICSLGMLAVSGFWPLLVFTFLGGIGGSFISGADDALIYDTLKELKKADEFKPISSMSESIELVAFAITILIGGLLGSVNLLLPLIAHIALLGMSVLISYLLLEPRITAKGEKIEQVGYLLHARKSIRTIFSGDGFRSGLLGSFASLALILAVFKSTKNILSPVLDQYGLAISAIGLITSLIILIKAVGAFIASKVSKKGNEMKEVNVSLFVCIVGLLAVTFVRIPLFQLFVFVIIIGLDNVILINLKSFVNGKIESEQRSTILSLLSLFARSTEMIFLTTFGWMVGAYPFSAALLFTIVWLTCCLLILVFFSKPSVRLS
jgi:MFS family permease